jgi:hypothetical protein
VKRLLALGALFCCVIQAQENSNWINLLPVGFFNRTEKLGVLTATASPGERVATTFSYKVTNDSVSGYCEQIYFKGVTSTGYALKKRTYFAFIPKNRPSFQDVYYGLTATQDRDALASGDYFCFAGSVTDTSGYTDIDFDVPASNPTVKMQNLHSATVKYKYYSPENTLEITVLGATFPKK